MTITERTNGHRPNVTVGDGVRVCVRASETPTDGPIRPDPVETSAFTGVHTRAIPQDDPKRQTSKVRDFVSLHKGAVQAAAATSWFGRERPQALYDVAGDVFPTRGEASTWFAWVALSASGLLRLAGLSVCYLAAFCFTTRIRATVTALTLAIAIGAHAALN